MRFKKKERVGVMNLKDRNLIDTEFVNRLNEAPISELSLTTREREIMILLAQGQTNKEISYALMLRPATVRNHISSIFAKLKISNRSQATAIAIYSGLLNINLPDKELKTV